MSLGTFSFSILLGIFALSLPTRDGANRRHYLLRSAAVAVVVLVGFLGVIYWSPAPAKQTGFWDLALGASREDVRFLKGAPDSGSADSDTWIYFGKPDSLSNGGRRYRGDVRYTIQFRDDHVWIVVAYSVLDADGIGGGKCLGPCETGQSLQGVQGGIGVQRVESVLGKPTVILSHDGGFERVYLYPELNLVFILKQGKVWFYGVYDSDLGDPGLGDLRLLAELKRSRVALR